jgi:hypothetical protein
MSISMYFGVSWLDPRLAINETAIEWTEVKTGPKNVNQPSLQGYVVWGEKFDALNIYFAGSQRLPREPQVYMVSRAGDLRP